MRDWYLIQYTPNPQARQPINVGVVVHDDHDNWAVRMLFVTKQGAVDAAAFRNLGGPLTAEEYAGWVNYYKRAILEGRWEQAVTLHLRRKVSFHVLKGGTLLTSTQSVAADARDLFNSVVSKKLRDTRSTPAHIRQRTIMLLDAHNIPHRDNITVPGTWGETKDTIAFALASGDTLIEPLALGGPHGGLFARDFHARASARARTEPQQRFIVTYSSADLAESNAAVIKPITALATAIDLDHEDPGEQLKAAIELE